MTNHQLLKYSDAALAIASHLRSPYYYLRYSKIIPRFIRNGIYKLIAANRFRFAGKYEHCLIPSAIERRFFKPSKEAV